MASSNSEQLRLLFARWDITGVEKVPIGEMEQMVATFEPPRSATPTSKQSVRTNLCNATQDEQLDNFVALCKREGFRREINATQLEFIVCSLIENELIPAFIDHVYNTLEYTHDLTEEARQNKALWQLFHEWSGGTDKVDYELVFDVVSTTQPFKSDVPACRVLLNSIVPPYSKYGLTLREFRKFIRSLMNSLYWPAHEFYTALRDLQRTWEDKMTALTNVGHTLTPAAKARKAKAQKKLEAHHEVLENIASHRAYERNHRIDRLQSQLRHSWDGVKIRDLVQVTQVRKLPTWIQIVTAPACIILKIKPQQTWQEDWYLGLKEQITKSPVDFLQRVRTFDIGTLTERQMQHVMAYHYNPEFDASFLLPFSPVYAAIADWVKTIVKILSIKWDWEFTPNVPLQHGEDATIFPNCEAAPPSHPQVETATVHLLHLMDKVENPHQPKLLTANKNTYVPTPPSQPRPTSGGRLPALKTKKDGIEITTYKGPNAPFLSHPFVQSSLAIRRSNTIALEPQMASTHGILDTYAPAAIATTTTVSTVANHPKKKADQTLYLGGGHSRNRAPTAINKAHIREGYAHRLGKSMYSPQKRYHSGKPSPLKINQFLASGWNDGDEEDEVDQDWADGRSTSKASTPSLSSLLTVPSDMFMKRTTETHEQHVAIIDALNEEMEMYNSPFAFIEPEVPPTGPRPDFQPTEAALFDDLT